MNRVVGDLKYLFLYLFEATERMEERAKEFADTRKSRMGDFREERLRATKEARERFEAKRSEAGEKVRDQVQAVMKETGLVTRDEFDELKGLIKDLAKKVEKAGSKK